MASLLNAYKIAVLGAADGVGREVVQILAERGVPRAQIRALSPHAGHGMSINYGDNDDIDVQDLTKFDFTAVDVAINALPGKDGIELARGLLTKIAADGTLVVDLSGAFRTDPDVKPAVPEVNGEVIANAASNIIACPGPLATMLSLVIKPLHEAAGVSRAVIATYQSVSTAGRRAMDELFAQTRAVYVNDALQKEEFAKQIAFNVIPQTAPFRDDGMTEEEFAVMVELKQLIGTKLKVVASCAYVPAFLGQGIALSLEFERELDADGARNALRHAPGVSVVDMRAEEGYVTLIEAVGEDRVFVSRIRDDSTVDSGIQLWVAGDNMRKGSALNAVQIVESWARRRLN